MSSATCVVPSERRLTRLLGPSWRHSDFEQADFDFGRIDVDRTGYVEAFELRMLLVEWGAPVGGVDQYAE